MGECMNTVGAKAGCNDRISTHTNSLRKIINKFEQQLKKTKEFHVLQTLC